MKRGEHSLGKIEQKSTSDVVCAEVTLHDFQRAPKPWILKGDENIAQAKKLKDDGSAYFKNGRLDLAKKKYNAAVQHTLVDSDMNDEQKKECKGVQLLVYLNLAACEIREKQWLSVIEYSNKALEIQPGNTKALLRRGKAYVEQDNWDEAKSDFNYILNIENSAELADAKKEMAKLQQKIREHDIKDKRRYSNMFSRLRDMDATSTTTTHNVANVTTPAESSSNSPTTTGISVEQPKTQGQVSILKRIYSTMLKNMNYLFGGNRFVNYCYFVWCKLSKILIPNRLLRS
jgi:tetratricopeptide (TPR) repeat protein